MSLSASIIVFGSALLPAISPVDFEQFLEAARQIGMYWLMLNTAPPDPVRSGNAPAAR